MALGDPGLELGRIFLPAHQAIVGVETDRDAADMEVARADGGQFGHVLFAESGRRRPTPHIIAPGAVGRSEGTALGASGRADSGAEDESHDAAEEVRGSSRGR